MSFNIEVDGGTSVRLPTAGKYCDRDIVVTATGGGGGIEWFEDGDTHIWITLHEGRTSPRLGVCPNGTVTVDWGDGTAPDTLTGTSDYSLKLTPTHEYAKPGNYVITLSVDGEMGFYTNEDEEGNLMFCSETESNNHPYEVAVKKIEMGNNVTNIGADAFNYYYPALEAVTISNGLTGIGDRMFRSCVSLSSVVFPSSVMSISGNAFAECYAAFRYDFTKHTAVPKLWSTDEFAGIPYDCEICVPAALEAEWKAATNWTEYADNIVGV